MNRTMVSAVQESIMSEGCSELTTPSWINQLNALTSGSRQSPTTPKDASRQESAERPLGRCSVFHRQVGLFHLVNFSFSCISLAENIKPVKGSKWNTQIKKKKKTPPMISSRKCHMLTPPPPQPPLPLPPPSLPNRVQTIT